MKKRKINVRKYKELSSDIYELKRFGCCQLPYIWSLHAETRRWCDYRFKKEYESKYEEIKKTVLCSFGEDLEMCSVVKKMPWGWFLVENRSIKVVGCVSLPLYCCLSSFVKTGVVVWVPFIRTGGGYYGDLMQNIAYPIAIGFAFFSLRCVDKKFLKAKRLVQELYDLVELRIRKRPIEIGDVKKRKKRRK